MKPILKIIFVFTKPKVKTITHNKRKKSNKIQQMFGYWVFHFVQKKTIHFSSKHFEWQRFTFIGFMANNRQQHIWFRCSPDVGKWTESVDQFNSVLLLGQILNAYMLFFSVLYLQFWSLCYDSINFLKFQLCKMGENRFLIDISTQCRRRKKK